MRLSRPMVSSIIRRRSSTNVTSEAYSTFGIMMQSMNWPAFSTISATSRWHHFVYTPFARTTTVFPDQSPSLRAWMTLPRASSFARGATESSRSMNTSSAGSVGPLASIFGLDPGTDRQERRGLTTRSGMVTNPPGNPWSAMVDGARPGRDNGRAHAFPCLPPLAAHRGRGRAGRDVRVYLPARPRPGVPPNGHRYPGPGPGGSLTGCRDGRCGRRLTREARGVDPDHSGLRAVPVHDGGSGVEADRGPARHRGCLVGGEGQHRLQPSRGGPPRCTGCGFPGKHRDPGHSARVDGRAEVRLVPTPPAGEGIASGPAGGLHQ